MSIDVTGIPKHLILKALYLQAAAHLFPGPINVSDDKAYLTLRFNDYTDSIDLGHGFTFIGIDIQEDFIDPSRFDASYGKGSCAEAIEKLKLDLGMQGSVPQTSTKTKGTSFYLDAETGRVTNSAAKG